MKATLHFNLPDDDYQFEAACQAGALASTLSEVERHLRDRLKYGELSTEAKNELEEVRTIIFRSEVKL